MLARCARADSRLTARSWRPSTSPDELRSRRAKPVEKVRPFGRHRPDWPPRPVARGPSICPISAVKRHPWPRPAACVCPLFIQCHGHACPRPWRCARHRIDARRPLRAGTPRRAGRRSTASSRPWSAAAGHAHRPDCGTHQVGEWAASEAHARGGSGPRGPCRVCVEVGRVFTASNTSTDPFALRSREIALPVARSDGQAHRKGRCNF